MDFSTELSLEQKLSDQMQDIFLTAGSAVNGFLAAYIIISILISQMPFYLRLFHQKLYQVNIQKVLLEYI